MFTIRDGFTESDQFPGQHWIPSFKFTYRPALHERVQEWRESLRTGNAKAVSKANVDFIKEHLVSWEVEDDKGNPMSVTDDAVYTRLPSPIIDFLTLCISNYGPDRWKGAAKN